MSACILVLWQVLYDEYSSFKRQHMSHIIPEEQQPERPFATFNFTFTLLEESW